MIVFDVETVRPIATGKTKIDKNYIYASGWGDYKGMGISVACFYDYNEDRMITMEEGDFDNAVDIHFIQDKINKADIISGFNIKKFDNNLLHVHGVYVPPDKCYDILENLWLSVGLDPLNFDRRTHGGYSLEKVLSANFNNIQKTMNGINAPFMWQDGKRLEVIAYCINDVEVERALLEKIFNDGGLIDPKTKKFVKMPIPRGI